MLLFTAATLALFAGSAVQAATFTVDVGAGGNTFTPPSVSNATTGDIIIFTFKGGNHTVTQSTFANPCTALATGQDSGHKPAAGVTPAPTYNLTINGTDPTWYYCKTGTHCKGGMVFAVNPTADKTYDTFKANAANSTPGGANGTASTAPSGTASGSTAPAATSSGVATGRASVGIGAVAAALLFGGMNAI